MGLSRGRGMSDYSLKSIVAEKDKVQENGRKARLEEVRALKKVEREKKEIFEYEDKQRREFARLNKERSLRYKGSVAFSKGSKVLHRASGVFDFSKYRR